MFGKHWHDDVWSGWCRREVESMSSRVSSGLAVAGGIMMLLGLCFLPAALGDSSDASTLEMGACLFSAGSLIAALGTYFKARALKTGAVAVEAPSEATPKRKARGRCELCGTEAPVVLCT